MVEPAHTRILVVDDELAIRVTLDALLRRRGYIVESAANGEEALGWLMQCAFDLLLIDLRLPGMNGLVLAQCAQTCQPSAKIVFLTGSSDFNGVPLEEQVGYFEYILKTDSPQAVMDRVASMLGHQDKKSVPADEHRRWHAGDEAVASWALS
ncbi:MAG TPA: response regulator [Roseiflexaceae bacterium]